MTLRFLIAELIYDKVPIQQLSKRPRGLNEYLAHWLRTLDDAVEDAPGIYDLLCACSVAQGPITAKDLAALKPAKFDTGYKFRKSIRSVQRFIIGNGNPENGYVFSHPRLREAFYDQLIPQEIRIWEKRLIEYGRKVFRRILEVGHWFS